jgi:acetyltransferase
MLGVARLMTRLMSDPDRTRAEFAVLVGDPWQGQGVGAELLQRLMAIARERAMELLWGTVLAENKTMLSLARKLGFAITRGELAGDFDLQINLKALPASAVL